MTITFRTPIVMTLMGVILAMVLLTSWRPSNADADPGAIDTAFGRNGSLQMPRVSRLTKLRALDRGGLAWLGDPHIDGQRSWPGFGRVTGLGRARPTSLPLGAVHMLRTGQVVSWTHADTALTISRRTSSGRLDPTFGVAGRLTVSLPIHTSATIVVADDGRIALWTAAASAATIRMLNPSGTVDDGFAPYELGSERAHSMAFDDAGTLVVTTTKRLPTGVTAGRLLRLNRAGAFETPPVAFADEPTGAHVGPHGGPILVYLLANDKDVLLHLRRRVRRLIWPSQSGFATRSPSGKRLLTRLPSAYGDVAFDPQGRLVSFNEYGRLSRLRLDGTGTTTIRRSPPRVGKFGWRSETMTVGRDGRIFLGGYKLLDGNSPPGECDFCRDDTADTHGLIVAFEGGVNKISLANRRLGPTVTVLCHAEAAERCAGTLRLTARHRRTVQRKLRIPSGARARFVVPRALRAGRRAVIVSARIHDRSGELGTFSRRLKPQARG